MPESETLLKVLLVDDEPFITKGLAVLVDWNALGFAIEGAVSNGRQALTFLKKHPVDLIIADIQMPVMDGWQATREIRRLENAELADIPIIALSADAFESDEKKSIQCGMDAHLTKPIDIPLLLDTMAAAVHDHGLI